MKANAPLSWIPLKDAALTSGVSPNALRKQLERDVKRARDGGVGADSGELRARKVANRWRVVFGIGRFSK